MKLMQKSQYLQGWPFFFKTSAICHGMLYIYTISELMLVFEYLCKKFSWNKYCPTSTLKRIILNVIKTCMWQCYLHTTMTFQMINCIKQQTSYDMHLIKIQCLAKVFIPLGVYITICNWNRFGFNVMDIHKIVQIGQVKWKKNFFFF